MLGFFQRHASGKTRAEKAIEADLVPVVQPERLTPERLSRFHAFSTLAHDELVLLTEKLEPQVLGKGGYLFEVDAPDPMDYLLLEGNLRLSAKDGSTRELLGGTDCANRVVTGLRPRKYSALAVTDCIYLALDPEVLGELTPVNQSPVTTGDVDFIEYLPEDFVFARDYTVETAELLESFHADLAANRFTLTSIPDVAMKIRNVMGDSEVPAEVIADILSTDPAMAAKISKAANSALYRGYEPCNSVVESVIRLGVPTTRQLVLSYAMRDLFICSLPGLSAVMRSTWERIVYIGAIAAVLARHSGGFTREQGMLAGLISNIGVLSVFNYLTNYPEICGDEAQIHATVDELKGEVGSLVLERWGFPEELVTCARNCGDWAYDHEAERSDLCDLVVSSNYHASIGKLSLPPITAVPACKRLLGPDLCPDYAINFMRDARQEIDEARSLIDG